MTITIIGVGKIKEHFMLEAVEEYKKRLNQYCKLHFVEVPDEKAQDKLSDKEMQQIKSEEGENILKLLKNGMYVIALDIQGKMLSSEELADKLNALALRGNSSVAFIIGGSLGLSDEILKRADFRLSFSPMTFPHQLMRVILMEQIYRSFKIIRNEPYHK